MATYTISPYAKKQFFDDSGNPLSAGRIYTYASGTTTPLSTYQTSSGTAWGAYVLLDSAGRPTTGDIYLLPGQSYKFIAQDSAGNVLWTQDGIGAVPPSAVNVDITGTAGENLTAGDLCYIGTGGSWFKADADAVSTSIAPVMGFCVTSVSTGEGTTFRTGGQIELGGPLVPAGKYYASATAGAITVTAPSNTRFVGQASSLTTLIIAPNPPPIVPATSTITTTGTSTALAIPSGTGDLVIFANNATLLTLQGITAGLDGQSLTIYSKGAGQIDLSNDNGAANAGNRILNGSTTTISLAPGSGRVSLRYDLTTARWRVFDHEQGAAIAYTPTWTSTGTGPTIGDGTITGSYVLKNRLVTMEFRFVIGGTTSTGTGTYSWTLPLTAANAGRFTGMALILDSGTAYFPSGVIVDTTTTFQVGTTTSSSSAGASVPMTWASGDTMRVTVTYEVP